jgi:MFS transporter, DHA1 family, inner membrane transport protein
VPLDFVPWVLFGMGFVGFFGNLIGGRLGDWNIAATMAGVIAIVIVLLVILSQVATLTWGAVIVLWLIWFVGFGFPAQARSRILKATNDAPNFVSTLVASAFNVGIATGAAVGGAAVAAGWRYDTLPLISAVGLGFALIGSLVLFAHDRRPMPVATSA